jgi:hypothetical protein
LIIFGDPRLDRRLDAAWRQPFARAPKIADCRQGAVSYSPATSRRSGGFFKLIIVEPYLPGDYNKDGIVDAADYKVPLTHQRVKLVS